MASTLVHITAATHFPIKLTPQNFPSWRKQVHSTLIGLELEHHIVGTQQPPSETIPEGTTTKPNPEYLKWFRQDQMIISAIIGSCSDQIQPIVSSADTARQAWDLLNSSYASGSRSRIISLKSRLAKNPRGSRSITEYLNDMKSIFDELALTQSPIPEEDLVVHVMNQLGDDYANLIAAFKTRDTTIAFPDLFEKLLDHERTLKESAPEPTISTVNYTHRNNQNRPYNRNSRPSSAFTQPSPNRSSSLSSKPTSSQPNNRTNRSNLFCYYCNIPGHETKECRKLGRFLREHQVTTNTSSTTTPTVNHTSPQAGSNSWMWDTGANDHAGNGRNSVHVLSEYGGPDEIVLGNGPTHGGTSHAGH
ncbi:putative RNA-directed DNA polymerase [Helianthus debilis subsp. tardiflorus]